MRFSLRAAARLTLMLVGWAGGARHASAASLARQLDTIFAPTRVEQAALARDGKHLCFALRDDRELQLVIYDLEHPEAKARLRVDAPSGAQVRHLEWIAPDRLVAAVDDAVVLVVDARAGILLQLDEAKEFSLPGEKRSGRPAVRVLGGAEEGDAVRVELQWLPAGGSGRLDLINVNVRTFERRLVLSREVNSAGGGVMLDRQGRPRILFSSTGMTRRFYHLPVDGGRDDWQPFDRVAKGATPAAWQVTPRNVIGERAFPLGFDGDPQVVYFASNVGRDTFGIYALDLGTGAPTGFAIEDPARDLADPVTSRAEPELVFDRARQTLAGFTGPRGTRWLDAEVAGVQAQLAVKFPGRDVRIMEWDDARARFLATVTAPIDAGRYFVYHRDDGRCVEYQRNPAPSADDTNRVEPLVFATAGGDQVTGTVTWPHAPAGVPPALVVWLHDGPWQEVGPGFQPEAQALAAAGFAVAQINYRGSTGFGRRRLELIRSAFDRVPLEDALAATAVLAAQGRIDRTRVTVAGEGFGGYLALRARQLHPEVFCGAAAINAPLDLAQLHRYERDMAAFQREAEQSLRAANPASRAVPGAASEGAPPGDFSADAVSTIDIAAPPPLADVGGGGGGGGGPAPPVSFEREFSRWFFALANRQDIAITAELERLTGPVLFLHDPRLVTPAIGPVRKLREALVRRKQAAELVELSPTFARGAAEARATIFREIGEFLAACRGDDPPVVRLDAPNR